MLNRRPEPRKAGPRAGGLRRGLLVLVIVLVLGVAGAAALRFFQPGPAGPAPAREDPHAQVARRAAERMAGARCVGARADGAARSAIARLLAVEAVSPRGRLPAWLPDAFAMPPDAVNGSEAWNALAAGCPHAPAFGTPFGFPAADIEKELRQDPAFAAVSDRLWAEIRGYQAGAADTGRR